MGIKNLPVELVEFVFARCLKLQLDSPRKPAFKQQLSIKSL